MTLRPRRDLVAENNAQIQAEAAQRATAAALEQQVKDLTAERDALAARLAAAERLGRLLEERDLDAFELDELRVALRDTTPALVWCRMTVNRGSDDANEKRFPEGLPLGQAPQGRGQVRGRNSEGC